MLFIVVVIIVKRKYMKHMRGIEHQNSRLIEKDFRIWTWEVTCSIEKGLVSVL